MSSRADAEEGKVVKMREVTKKDVADAAMIALLIGGADMAGVPFCCIDLPRPKLHNCPDCDHHETVAKCEHRGGEWECVPPALGASSRAFDLWMKASNALTATTEDRKGDLDYHRRAGTKQELKECEQLYAWVDSIREGGINHGSLGLNGLEVAAVLRDGHLPPGWKVATKLTKKRRKVPREDNAPVDKQVLGELPMIRIVMTPRGPWAT